MKEDLKKEIVQRIIRNLTDIQILTLIKAQPLWGYKIKKQIEKNFGIKLRHGALYPMLRMLETKGFVVCKVQKKWGRVRKVYSITEKGLTYLKAYEAVLSSQLENLKS
jgi:DNA-binding PadR family transcriptional regulator